LLIIWKRYPYFYLEQYSDEDLNKWYERRDKYELLEEFGGAAY